MWRAIETAPRDGTVIKARDATGKDFNCRWWTMIDLAEWDGDDTPEAWHGEHGWYEFIGDDGEDGDCVEPTFWWDKGT